ncbi:hypothetical protein BKH46_01355 [Helicobacter sp. 12S02634-8]|uniref:RDD family protein n=1 Tax=Helicobacter sp. 12S02634-8 TaxID=1476199 RepID=UPI000BA772F5|nr:RDD family protein [Helicobacter sp. 12S02634-8]PAF48574.1 hypothetical protein BKH46_01355 [Helicobacter sp. 12S02634-8]
MNWSDEKIEALLFREDLHIASFSHRAGAFLFDIFLVLGLTWSYLSVFYPHLATLNTIEAKIFWIQRFVFFYFILFILYDFFLMFFFGSTLGKVIFKLRVLSLASLDRPSLKILLARSLMKTLGEIAFFLPFIFVFDDRFLRAVYDKFLKTIVVSSG